MILYSNSCSFGAPGQGHKIYPEIVADKLNYKLINKGRPSSCNRRIIRTTVRDLTELTSNNETNILAFVGLSFLTRTELWQPNIDAVDNDGNFHSLQVAYTKINWKNGLINTNVPDIHLLASPPLQEYYKQWLLHMSKEALLTDLLTDVIMLTGFCQARNIKLLLWENTQLLPSGPDVALDDIFLKSLVTDVASNINIIDPWKFSFSTYALEKGFQPKDYAIYGDTGHPGQNAHLEFSKYIINQLSVRNLL